MPDWLLTVIHGVVEGITEFIPISSTGHLLISQYFLDDPRSEFFTVGIQSGAVLAVVLIYWRKLLDLGTNFQEPAQRDYLLKMACAFAITVVTALACRAMGMSLPEAPEPVAWAVLIGGFGILIAEWRVKHGQTTDHVTWNVAVAIGLAQTVAAIFPGTSRSGATIIIALLLGCSRMKATEFSFLLGIPTMFAAGAYAFFSIYRKEGSAAFDDMDQFILGFLVSMIVGFAAVKWLLGFLRTHSFVPFAWYRIILGSLLIWYFVF